MSVEFLLRAPRKLPFWILLGVIMGHFTAISTPKTAQIGNFYTNCHFGLFDTTEGWAHQSRLDCVRTSDGYNLEHRLFDRVSRGF